MFDPEDHAEHRGAIQRILGKIPGFSGYLNRESRRASDQLVRQSLADRLQRAKRGLDQYSRALADVAKIDQLPLVDRVRGRLDTLITRLRGAPAGYSGFFDLVQVDEDLLEEVYEHDLYLVDQVEQLAQDLEAMGTCQDDPSQLVPKLGEKLDGLDQQLARREDLLKGMSTQG
jgi:hypothetical protein